MKRQLQRPEEINQKYLEEYYKNEYDANKNMAFANAFAAGLVTIVFILYAVKIFTVHFFTYVFAMIALPITIFILISPLFYIKSSKIQKPRFKNFLIFSLILVVAVLNVMTPKHAMIAWAIPIVMVNHYYNPKLGIKIFVICLVLMLVCMYGGMFVGEYDNNLLTSGLIEDNVLIQPDDPIERWDMLLIKMHEGDNRYLKVFGFYYIPRAILLTLIFFISNALNLRTYKLLVSEIRVNTEQQKMTTELEVAKSIQLETLPNDFVTTKDVRIIAELIPAKEVGGDFYDYFNIDNDHLGIVIGDVSGKGVPAAMFMMKTITCFKNLITIDKTPSQILSEVNAAIYDGNQSHMFVTCFFAILNKRTGELKYSNAGHNPPIIGSNGKFHYLSCNPGFILGNFEKCFSIDEQTYLKGGDSITLYTDGITEARNKKGELYGEKRFLSCLNSKDFYSIVEMNHEIKDDVAKFVDGAEQSDDMTMLTLLYHGDNFEVEEKLYNASLENMPQMLQDIRTFCEEENIEPEFAKKLLIVGDELYSNIINHGYAGNTDGTIFTRLLYNKDKNEFVMSIIDKAPAFNQLEVNNSPVSGDAMDLKIGGLGILIVKNVMSEYAYDRINGKNILVLRKKF